MALDLNFMIQKMSSIFFPYRKHFSKKYFRTEKYFSKIENFQKFSLKTNIENFKKVENKLKKISKKSRFFQFFRKFLYWFSMKHFEIFRFSKKYFFQFENSFSKIFFDKKKIIFFDDFFLSSKSYQVPCSHKFSACNSIYKNMKTQH